MIILDEDRSDREYIEKQVDATTARTLVYAESVQGKPME